MGFAWICPQLSGVISLWRAKRSQTSHVSLHCVSQRSYMRSKRWQGGVFSKYAFSPFPAGSIFTSKLQVLKLSGKTSEPKKDRHEKCQIVSFQVLFHSWDRASFHWVHKLRYFKHVALYLLIIKFNPWHQLALWNHRRSRVLWIDQIPENIEKLVL